MIVDDTPPPFWERIREISAYPAHSASMMTLVVLAILSLGILIGGLLGLIIYLAVLAGLYKYGFAVLRASANGRLEAPETGLNSSESSGWGAIGLQLLLTIGVAVSFRGGVLLGFATTFIVILALPGIAMSYAMDESFGRALNPLTWFEIMSRIGGGYFAAFGLILVILASSAAVQNFLGDLLHPAVALPLVVFVAGYGMIAAFHLMGYLIYQYHEKLGYEPQVQKPLARTISDPDQALLDDVAQMLRDGEIDMAHETMREHVRSRGGTDAVHTQYRKLLRMKSDAAELLRHGKEWLPILLSQDKEKAALDVTRELVELDPTFVPGDAESNTRLARRAAALNQTQLALRLVNGFHKRYPKSADIPANYLLAARLLSERMGKDAEAKALLTQLKTAYPDHALMPEIDALLRIIDATPARKPA